ncbi:putative sporulation protein YtxC [Anaeromicrobium sediminis]|uniref:Sporulation protein YtxC n=1 Tax=Anaeromicrobium sediminis TaxID=1478221 RepID=A0A267MIP3_9FIRM|nr:putative sporulation protein YtxC [Anaeromicrobium sediminis]PAB59439.1 hypothetical protein CCE28_09480 [Anaeromicrobium sediminis]
MVILTILLYEYTKDIRERLKKELNLLGREGINIDEDISANNGKVVIDYKLSDNITDKDYIEYAENRLKCEITNGLSDMILDKYEISMAKKILEKEYFYFSPYELNSILSHYVNLGEQDVSETNKRKLKSVIFKPIMRYLKSSSFIDIEGFIRFRLREFTNEVEYKIDKAIGDYLMEKEYNEFIKLLKYFVEIQDAKIDLVNVFMNVHGKYYIYDHNNRLINDEYLEELANEMTDKEIGYDDLLISSLITLAPNKIIIHPSHNITKKEIINTIKKVFSGKVQICSGCKMCMNIKNAIKE